VVQELAPAARVVYVDNDPIVLRHAEALLRSTPEGLTRYMQADVREPQRIIAGAKEILDFDRPIALSMVALLHFLSDEHRPYELVEELLGALPSGSHLVLSHVTGDFAPETWDKIVAIYRDSGVPAQVRTRAEFTRFFEGLDLVEPGIQVATDWHPAPGEETLAARVPVYVGVARKP
jgi:hypothetical protein